ncbi:hypothetical protein Tco_1108633 [Tanacetum coccineum]
MLLENESYSTVDGHANQQYEMRLALKGLQQGESLNVQDVKTNLFWEFGKFTSRDGESMESYYSRFYKLMNELTRNNLQVTIMQQFQKEVNDIRAERIAKSANPLALLAAAQPYSDTYYQAPKPQRSNATSSSIRQMFLTSSEGQRKCKRTVGTTLQRYLRSSTTYQLNLLKTSSNLGNRLEVSSATGLTWIQCFNCNGIRALCKGNDRKPKRLKTMSACMNMIWKHLQLLGKDSGDLAEVSVLLSSIGQTISSKDIEIKEGLKTKAYEISVLNQKHDELVKKSLLTKSQLEGYLKENTKVISDLKVKEEKDINKMIEME